MNEITYFGINFLKVIALILSQFKNDVTNLEIINLKIWCFSTKQHLNAIKRKGN